MLPMVMGVVRVADDSSGSVPSPTSLSGLRLSLSTLRQRFGTAGSWQAAAAINLGLALVGVVLMVLVSSMSGWVGSALFALAAAWTLINILGVLNSVIQQ